MIPLRRSAHPKYSFRGGSQIVSRISLRQMVLEILKDMYLPKDMGGLLIQRIILYYTIIVNLLRYYNFKRKYILFEKFDKRTQRLEKQQDDSFIF